MFETIQTKGPCSPGASFVFTRRLDKAVSKLSRDGETQKNNSVLQNYYSFVRYDV
jgi:hypothetical protein